MFFLSLPKVGAHNRVPSRLYYSVAEPLMRYPLEKLSGCCFLNKGLIRHLIIWETLHFKALTQIWLSKVKGPALPKFWLKPCHFGSRAILACCSRAWPRTPFSLACVGLGTLPCSRGPDGTRLSPRLPGGRGPGQRQRAPQPHELDPSGRQIEVLAQGSCGTVPSWQLTPP